MSESLVIGVPSKGRLQENTSAFFEQAGLPLVQARGARDYRGSIRTLENTEIAFLSASDIAQELARGSIHFGVTGLDLVYETLSEPRRTLEILAPLGFGQANVVVAVPEAWIDVHGMSDLEDVAASFHKRQGRRMRVATKYMRLTQQHFRKHGIDDYRIVESLGATEGAPAAGTAEIIVDITTTGSTLAANGLKVVDGGLILKSEAHLVAALNARWSDAAREAARAVLARINAEETARRTREIRAALPDGLTDEAMEALEDEGVLLPFGRDVRPSVLHCPAGAVQRVAAILMRFGAETVTVQAPDEIFRADVPLFEQLIRRLA